MAAWCQRHKLVLVAIALTAVFIAGVASVTYRVYDERQARVDAIAALVAQNTRIVREIEADRAARIRARCEQDHRIAETLRAMVMAALAPERRVTPEGQAFLSRTLPTIDAIDCKEPQ